MCASSSIPAADSFPNCGLVPAAIPALPRTIRRISAEHADVQRLMSLRTMQLGEDEFLAALKIQWRDGMSAEQIAAATNALESRIRDEIPRASPGRPPDR